MPTADGLVKGPTKTSDYRVSEVNRVRQIEFGRAELSIRMVQRLIRPTFAGGTRIASELLWMLEAKLYLPVTKRVEVVDT
jgi:hypothetical protein